MPRTAPPPDVPTFGVDGPAVARARRRANLTRADLAQVVGATTDSIRLMEGGHVGISVDRLGRIAHVLHVPVDTLLRPSFEHRRAV